MSKGVFSFLFHLKKNLGFGPSFCIMELNIMQKILAKRYPFFILDFSLKRSKKAKKSKSPHPPHKKFGILDGTKHTHENFGILYLIISK
jgi:hypothetical protein